MNYVDEDYVSSRTTSNVLKLSISWGLHQNNTNVTNTRTSMAITHTNCSVVCDWRVIYRINHTSPIANTNPYIPLHQITIGCVIFIIGYHWSSYSGHILLRSVSAKLQHSYLEDLLQVRYQNISGLLGGSQCGFVTANIAARMDYLQQQINEIQESYSMISAILEHPEQLIINDERF